jgi:lactate permease
MWPLSTFVAAIPVLLVFYLLAGRGMKPHLSALSGAGAAMVIASTAFGMPWKMSGASFLFGAAFGIKIAWIVVCAVYLYDISAACRLCWWRLPSALSSKDARALARPSRSPAHS